MEPQLMSRFQTHLLPLTGQIVVRIAQIVLADQVVLIVGGKSAVDTVVAKEAVDCLERLL